LRLLQAPCEGRRKGKPAYAVCNSGAYAGNVDTGDDFIYSGEVRSQVYHVLILAQLFLVVFSMCHCCARLMCIFSEDAFPAWAMQGRKRNQTFTKGNEALQLSWQQGMPVRVIRQKK
jgi:SAD/SRA domain